MPLVPLETEPRDTPSSGHTRALARPSLFLFLGVFFFFLSQPISSNFQIVGGRK